MKENSAPKDSAMKENSAPIFSSIITRWDGANKQKRSKKTKEKHKQTKETDHFTRPGANTMRIRRGAPKKNPC